MKKRRVTELIRRSQLEINGKIDGWVLLQTLGICIIHLLHCKLTQDIVGSVVAFVGLLSILQHFLGP